MLFSRSLEFCEDAPDLRSVAGAGALNICCLVGNMAKSRLSMRREVEAAEAAEAGIGQEESHPQIGCRDRRKGRRRQQKNVPKRVTRTRLLPKNAKPPNLAPSAPKKPCSEASANLGRVQQYNARREGRFLYHEKDKADEMLATLSWVAARRRYFMQPMKEALNAGWFPCRSVMVLRSPLIDDIEEDEVKIEVDAEAADEVDLDADLEGDEEEVEEVGGRRSQLLRSDDVHSRARLVKVATAFPSS